MQGSKNRTSERLENHLQSNPASILLEKWIEWRGPELAPKRSQIIIEELGEALPQIVMVEFTSPEECRFLFAGSGLVHLQGLEITGLNFYDLALPEERGLRMRRLQGLAQKPCGSYSIQPGTLSAGGAVRTELLALPVFPDAAGNPLRGIAVSTPLNDPKHQMPVQESRVIRVAEEFRYIDIGAGIPDEDATLDCQTPLTL